MLTIGRAALVCINGLCTELFSKPPLPGSHWSLRGNSADNQSLHCVVHRRALLLLKVTEKKALERKGLGWALKGVRGQKGWRCFRWGNRSVWAWPGREAPLPGLPEEALPGCHGDGRRLWAGGSVKPSEQKRWTIPQFLFLSRLWNGSKCQSVFF